MPQRHVPRQLRARAERVALVRVRRREQAVLIQQPSVHAVNVTQPPLREEEQRLEPAVVGGPAITSRG